MQRKSIPGLQSEEGTVQSRAASSSLIAQASDAATGRRKRRLPTTLKAAATDLSDLHPPPSPHSITRPLPLPPAAACKGEDTCDHQPVTWQPSQKAAAIVARQGAGIYFHPVHFLVSSSGPPELLPGGPKKIHRRCFFSCLSIPESEGEKHTHSQTDTHTDAQKKKRANFPSFCPFLPQDKGVVYCTPLRDSHIHTQSLFDGE